MPLFFLGGTVRGGLAEDPPPCVEVVLITKVPPQAARIREVSEGMAAQADKASLQEMAAQRQSTVVGASTTTPSESESEEHEGEQQQEGGLMEDDEDWEEECTDPRFVSIVDGTIGNAATAWDVSGCGLADEDLLAMVDVLRDGGGGAVTTLDLSRNALTDEGVRALCMELGKGEAPAALFVSCCCRCCHGQ
jgi:hypothetical protein